MSTFNKGVAMKNFLVRVMFFFGSLVSAYTLSWILLTNAGKQIVPWVRVPTAYTLLMLAAGGLFLGAMGVDLNKK
jgi:hypothetical protein